MLGIRNLPDSPVKRMPRLPRSDPRCHSGSLPYPQAPVPTFGWPIPKSWQPVSLGGLLG
jgi:hypothetical protein